jgi:hypothetical protein
MELFFEQIIGLKQLIYNKKEDGSDVLSKLKVFVLFCFFLSYISIFVGFAFLPESEKIRCQEIGTDYCYRGKDLPISDYKRYYELSALQLNPLENLNATEQAELQMYQTILNRYEDLQDKEGLNTTEQAELESYLVDLNSNRKLDDPPLVIFGFLVLNGLIGAVALKSAFNYHDYQFRNIPKRLFRIRGKKKYPLYILYILVGLYIVLLLINLQKFVEIFVTKVLFEGGNVSLEDVNLVLMFVPLIFFVVLFLLVPILLVSQILVDLWLALEAFILLSGVISLIHIITAEIKVYGYGQVNRYFLVMIMILISGFGFILTLWLNLTPTLEPNMVSFLGLISIHQQ